MKNGIGFFLCLVSASITLAQDATTQAINSAEREVESVSNGGSQSVAPVLQKSDVLAKLSLIDGSTLFCKLRPKRLLFTTAYGQKIKLDPETVKSIVFETEMRQAVVHFRNGDRLSGAFEIKVINVKSLLGKLDISLATVKKITFMTASQDNGAPGLVYWCTFNSIEAIQRPVAGPDGDYHSGVFVDGKSGKVLKTDGAKLTMAVTLPTGSFNNKGCVEFWARIEDPTRPFSGGGCPTFFTSSTASGYMRLEYNISNGHGMGGLCAVVAARTCGLPMSYSGNPQPYSSVLKTDPDGWHHYAIVWNDEGIKTIKGADGGTATCAVLLDGKVYSSRKFEGKPEGFLRMAEGPALLGISMPNPADYRDFPFAIDELKIWNYDKTEFGVLK